MTSRATETYAKKKAKSGRKNISIRLNEGKNRLVLKILKLILVGKSYTLNTIFIFPFFMFLYIIAFQQSKCTMWITNTKKPTHLITYIQN